MTVEYAVPEQFDDAYVPSDDITDICQLGAMFYELFTGRPSFDGHPFEVIEQVGSEESTPQARWRTCRRLSTRFCSKRSQRRKPTGTATSCISVTCSRTSMTNGDAALPERDAPARTRQDGASRRSPRPVWQPRHSRRYASPEARPVL